MIPLFDIDWTLVAGGSKVRTDSFDYALHTVYQLPHASFKEIPTDGMIDTQILMEIAKLHGFTENMARERIFQAVNAMEDYYKKHTNEEHYEPLPGVRELLIEMKKREIPIGLLTGNIEICAETKLAKAGIRDYFSFGAFGQMAQRRVELIKVAQQAYISEFHASCTNNDFILVGDSPFDIACAKEGKVKIIAVASGKFSQEQLLKAGADYVLGSLEEKDTFLKIIQ